MIDYNKLSWPNPLAVNVTAGIYGELKLLKGYLLEKLQKDKHSDFYF